MSEPRPPRPLSITAVYALLGALWIAVARWAVPAVIAAAYEGRSWSRLNQFFAARHSHPLSHYLALWNSFAGAVLLAGLAHLAVVLTLRAIDGRQGGKPPSAPDLKLRLRTSLILAVVSAAFLTLTVLSGARHDYVACVEIWDVVRAGRDPWWLQAGPGIPLNAYGPLFNVLALSGWVNPLANKLLFAVAYLGLITWLIKVFAPRQGVPGLPGSLVAAWLLNPFPWVEIAYFGHFDVLVGLASVAAVHARLTSRESASGAALAAGVLLKYVPAVIAPALIFAGRRIRPRVLFVCATVVVAGLAGSVVLWGSATFRPLTFAATRGSNLLSIFRFLRGAYSPLRLVWDTPNLDRASLPCLAVAALGVFAWCWIRQVGPALWAVLAMLATLLFYQVGFVQYQMVLFLLVSYWTLADWERWQNDGLLKTALAAYFGWLAGFDVWYATIGGVVHPDDPWNWVEDAAGLPTFALGCALLAAFIRASARRTGAVEARTPPTSPGPMPPNPAPAADEPGARGSS